MTKLSGKDLGFPPRYSNPKLLGRGGIGAVYRAFDRELQREVAIKVLTLQVRTEGNSFQRFQREAKILAGLSHPHLVTVFDHDFEGDPAWFAMERIEGRDLGARLTEEGRWPLERVMALADELGGAMDLLHDHGVLHRDLKPANVMIRDGDGASVVMDLGLARIDGRTPITRTGAMLGTPIYMPPELITEGLSSEAGDVFQVGAILFEALTGQRLARGANGMDVMHSIVIGDWNEFPRDVS